MRVGIQIIYSRENTTALFDEKKKIVFLDECSEMH